MPVFCIINLNIVSWTFLCYFLSHSKEFDSFEKVDFNINLHGDYKMKILKFCENFEILWKLKFFNFLKILKSWDNFEFFWNFRNLLKISEFSLIDNEVQVFRIKIKLLSNPVAELKIRENDSHWYCFDNYFTYFVPLFKYCYRDSRNLWTVMRAGGLAP